MGYILEIDKFLKKCFSESATGYIYYKPRKFIYTTSQIYSTLPEYFKENYKLINAPDTNNEEDIIERIRTTVSERHEKRFEDIEVDWRESIEEEKEQQPLSSSSRSSGKKDSQEEHFKDMEMEQQSTSIAITEIVNNTEISNNESNDESKSSESSSTKFCQNNYTEQSTSIAITEIVNNTEISTNESNNESKTSETNSQNCCQNNCCKILKFFYCFQFC